MNPTRRAFTLLEALISTGMFAAVMLMVTQSLDSGTQLNDRVSRTIDLNNRANDVINQLSLQLRLAAAGDPDPVKKLPCMHLPGDYPANFTPSDPGGVTKVKAYYFTVSTGIAGSTGVAADSTHAAVLPWMPKYERYDRVLIYDYSQDPGRLIMRRFNDSDGSLAQETLLSDQVAANGFDLTRAGNVLSLSLTLRTVNRQREEIIYTAKAQTIFLRSTMSDSSGASPSTFTKEPVDTAGTANDTAKTQVTPSLLFGNLITLVEGNKKQISLLITAPIGERLNPASMVLEIADGSLVYKKVEEGATVAVTSCSLTRSTQPAVAQWPSPSGTYILSLTGTIAGPINVRVTAETVSGKSCTDYRNY